MLVGAVGIEQNALRLLSAYEAIKKDALVFITDVLTL